MQRFKRKVLKQECNLNVSKHMPPSATLFVDVKFHVSVTKVNSPVTYKITHRADI